MHNKIDIYYIIGKINKFKKKLEQCNYFSPSYFYYMAIELNKQKYCDIKEKENKSKEEEAESEELSKLKEQVSEAMKYLFYFIDLLIIFIILLKNTLSKFKANIIIDEFLYATITVIVFFITVYSVIKFRYCVEEYELVKKIIRFNQYEENGELKGNSIKKKIVEISFSKYIYIIGGAIIFIGCSVLVNKTIKIVVAPIVIYYFIMRTVHYWVVFYEDFKNKLSKKFSVSSDKKMRYIKLALLNYVKIVLEFSILIYILKYMGWAFVNIKINTYFELVHFIVSGKLEATTTIEIFINLLRIATLAMVLTLNLAIYMALDVKKENNNIET